MNTIIKTLILPAAALTVLAACSGQTAESTIEQVAETAQEKTEMATTAAENALIPDEMVSAIPSGVYKSESGHAYIAFSYSHQGYSNPIVRWGKFDATLNLDNENPANSTLSVNIDPASVDTGVPEFNDHLKSADFFDVANYPNIAFVSTSMEQMSADKGKVTGDLTMTGVTKPLTLDVKLNKVGKHFRSGVPMFGISATGDLKRTDWGMDTYAPMAEDVTLMIEVEFQHEGEASEAE